MARRGGGALTNEWVGVVRRAHLSPGVKLVGLTLASYADRDGTRIFPGLARVSVQCAMSYSATQRAVRRLRDAGLLEVARRGARRSGHSDEYRLVLAPDVLDRIDVPNPDQEQKTIDELKTARAKAIKRHSYDA